MQNSNSAHACEFVDPRTRQHLDYCYWCGLSLDEAIEFAGITL